MKKYILILSGFLLHTSVAFAQETEVGNVQMFGDYVSQIWAWGTQIIFGISVIMLIVGGILYMAAHGEEERIDTARQVISGALVSTALMLLSGILFAVLNKPASSLGGSAQLSDASVVLTNITNILLGVVGGFCALLLVYNGIQYMLSAGDPEKIERAKRGLFFAIGGLIIALAAYFIVDWVLSIWL